MSAPENGGLRSRVWGPPPTPMVAHNFGISGTDLAEMEALFDEIDADNSNFISLDEIKKMLTGIGHTLTQDLDVDANILMAQADTNRSGRISKPEFFAAMRDPVQKTKWGLDDYDMDALSRYMASSFKDNPILLDKMAKRRPNQCWPPPFFIVLVSLVEVSIFAYYSSQDCDNGPTTGRGTGKECPQSYSSVLAYRMCCRDEVWRWLTYSLSHQGWAHLLGNISMQMAFGFYLEVVNGPLRIFLLYLVGVIAGSLSSSIFDPTSNVVGASGAVYAIFGAWYTMVAINWDTMHSKRKYVYAIGLFALMAIDVGVQLNARYTNDDSYNKVSVAGHAGGFLGGLTFGTYILRNSEESKYEIQFKWFGITLACTGLLVGILFNSFNDPDVARLCAIDYIAAKCYYD